MRVYQYISILECVCISIFPYLSVQHRLDPPYPHKTDMAGIDPISDIYRQVAHTCHVRASFKRVYRDVSDISRDFGHITQFAGIYQYHYNSYISVGDAQRYLKQYS